MKSSLQRLEEAMADVGLVPVSQVLRALSAGVESARGAGDEDTVKNLNDLISKLRSTMEMEDGIDPEDVLAAIQSVSEEGGFFGGFDVEEVFGVAMDELDELFM